MATPQDPTQDPITPLEHLAYLIAEMFVEEAENQLASQMLTKDSFKLLLTHAPYQGGERKALKAGC